MSWVRPPKTPSYESPGQTTAQDYPDRIRALGMYFTFLDRHSAAVNKIEEGKANSHSRRKSYPNPKVELVPKRNSA
jgi:hypothetical protein